MRYFIAIIASSLLVINSVSCKQSTGSETKNAAGEKSRESESARKTEAAEKAEPQAASETSEKDWAEDLFGKQLVKRDKTQVPVSELDDDKKIGLYFSAHWCPPCRAFTPVLVKVYNKLKEDGKPFEIVLIDLDQTEEAMFNYMDGEKMEWLAAPFDAPRQEIAQQFGVRGIPSLIILDADGKVIARNGRGDVSSQGADAYEQW